MIILKSHPPNVENLLDKIKDKVTGGGGGKKETTVQLNLALDGTVLCSTPTMYLDVVVPQGVERIQSYAFYFGQQFRVRNIDFPSTLTSIEAGVLSQMGEIQNFIVRAITPPTNNSNMQDIAIHHLYVPAESVDEYKNGLYGWSPWADVIQAMPEQYV